MSDAAMSDQCEVGEQTAFPLEVSADRRHLVDRNGRPFLYHADTGWQILWKLTRQEAEEYLERRRLQGFTAVQVQLLPHRTGQTSREGHNPFLSPGDLLRPNAAYFEHVDWVLAKALEKGLCVMLAPNWLSEWEQDWRNHLTVSVARDWGRFLAGRYGSSEHVLWMHGGDVDPGELTEATRIVATSIDETAPRQLQTYHACTKSSSVFFHCETWLDWNTAYDYGDVYPQVLEDYHKTPTKPVFLGESHYEDSSDDERAYHVRTQAYRAMLAGAAGHAYGHVSVWQCTPDWKRGMEAPGARHMGHLKDLLAARAWHKLVPDAGGGLLVSGHESGQTCATAARADDGSFALCYLPTNREVTVDVGGLDGPVEVRWYDPTSGGYLPVDDSPFTGGQRRALRPPADNAEGDPDFVMVLEAPGAR